MQKTQNKTAFNSNFLLHLILSIFIVSLAGKSYTQSGKTNITFYSSDSLLISADEYITADTLPYLLLIHDQGSSRGEFVGIIDRFQKMNFNCLVADIRNGGNSNFIANETAKRCRKNEFSQGVLAIEEDIRASVEFAYKKSGKQVILLGAGANGSLALKSARENENIKAVIALSPGEFFQQYFTIEDTISGLQKPVLITSTKLEFPYAEKLVTNVEDMYKIIFAPQDDEGVRGTGALLPDNASNGEYWLALLLFFKDLQ